MTFAYVQITVAGLMFGIWPLIMQQSGLRGMDSTALFVLISAAVILPVAFMGGTRPQSFVGTNWSYAIVAGVLASVGLIAFNGALSQARPESVGRLFVIMVMIQIATPAAYHCYVSGGLSLKTGAGLIAAAVAALLLV